MATMYWWNVYNTQTSYTYGHTTETYDQVPMLQTIDVYPHYSIHDYGTGADAYVSGTPWDVSYTVSPTQAGTGYFAWDWGAHKDFYVYYITSDGNNHMTETTIIHSAYATPYIEKGTYVGYVESPDPSAYPADGVQGAYWYVYGGAYEPTTSAEIAYKDKVLATLSTGSGKLLCKDKYMEDNITVTRDVGSVSISYNSATIAAFSDGVATLQCKGKAMLDDVTVIIS